MKDKLTLLCAAIVLCSACARQNQENIALMRTATASSSFDNNLTAQLLTDGLFCDEPAYLEVFTPDGAVDKVERENTNDGDISSRIIINGDSGWLEYRFHGYGIETDQARVIFQEALKGGRGGELHNVMLPVGKDAVSGSLRISLEMPYPARWRVKEVKFLSNGEEISHILPSDHFTSVWMSAGNEDEWVEVDLGSITRINGVRMNWIHRPENVTVEVSKDGLQWRRKARLSSGDNPSFNACARYIRIKMTGGPERFAMTELEVLGKSKSEGTCGSDWELQRASEVCVGGDQLSEPGYDCTSWIPARVPGTVLSSYIDLGAVPDPDFGDNWSQISESFFNSDFWYHREFEHKKVPGRRYLLEIDGINWKAEVYLNGTRLGDIAGAFIRSREDITDLLNDGANALAIRIIHNAHPGAVKTKTAKWTGYNGGILGADSPTYLASIGWDWMTTVRGRNCGIWDGVRICEKGEARLADPLIETVVSKDGKPSVKASVILVSDGPATVEGWIGETHFSKAVIGGGEISFSPKEFPQLKDMDLDLWWPNGYGKAILHDAGFCVRNGNGVSDSLCFKAGLREVRTTEDGGVLKLYINGVRINPKGGNWGFSQQNLRYTAEDFMTAMDYHVQMNLNIVRNWVGQIGDKAFYDACDACGVMIWQDFWLANPLDGPDPDDEGMFIANAKDYVRRIRNHPSLVLYCGRNEGFPPESLDTALRTDVVAALHPGIPYISSSADGPVGGRGPYRALPTEEYFAPLEKLHSERGMPNVAVLESLQEMMAPEDIWPQGEMWGKHDFTRDGAQQATTYNDILNRTFGEINDAESYAGLAQWLNYEGYRAIFEGANSSGRLGMILWMSHSCWPSLVFTTYDYFFRTGGAFYGSMKGCEPIHIQYNPISGKVEIVNSSRVDLKMIWAVTCVYNINGECISNYSAIVNAPADSTVENVEVGKPEGTGPYFIYLCLKNQNGHIYSENFYMIPGENGLKELRELPVAELQSKTVVKDNTVYFAVRNSGKVPALMMKLTLKDGDGKEVLPAYYSDNYFSLMPGKEKMFSISWNEDRTVTDPSITINQLQEY